MRVSATLGSSANAGAAEKAARTSVVSDIKANRFSMISPLITKL
jgi:hypothetical protein